MTCRKIYFKKTAILFFLIAFVFLSCSSAPKRAMIVTDVSNLACAQLEEANSRIAEENYIRAFNLISSAYKLALSIDNTELLCKILLSGLILKIDCPEFQDELFAAEVSDSASAKSFLVISKEEILELAKNTVRFSNEKEKKLLYSLCTIYEVKMLLEDEKSASGEEGLLKNAPALLAKLDSAKPYISKEPYYHGYFWRTRGEICMASKNYDEARKCFVSAEKIHNSERYLIETALDWYCIARACSMAGRKAEAVDAILTALKYDKDAENTNGIASDYKAYSRILLKGNPSEEEKKLAGDIAEWAQMILKAKS
ncbi:hypothetical protein DYE50_07570 [Treponema ruminis]|uniref:Tetratricopeptide (TPR) repeat protein n=1 Tax=Treponema ruminis TaxID=744515 RepID=A0A7W8G8D5_9SPIR|nr:hypothetical protein [Treponema ruminis]MBB5225735.1 tetratricopeptide (TPR) repeat protein [Treponema ruminis]QSI02425.1 hypothetical protein DYE50_07570 [Treponema ruminis]